MNQKDNDELIIIHSKANTSWAPIDPDTIERLRIQISEHIENNGSLSELDIEPNAPEQGMPFHFIHSAPKLSDAAKEDKTLWHRCSYCERSWQFIYGRIVYCADKKLRLIGNNCWEKHIDKELWKAAGEDFEIFQRRLKFKTLKERYIPAVQKFRDTLKNNRNEIGLLSAFVDNFAESFRKKFPELANSLDRAIKNNKALTVDTYIQLPNGKYESKNETIFYFNFEEALIQGKNAIQPVWNNGFLEINRAEHQFQNTDWESLSNRQFNTDMEFFKTRCREAIELAQTVANQIQVIWSFLSPNNIQGIVLWANNKNCELKYNTDGRYEVISAGLRYIPEHGDSVEMILPRTLIPIKADGADELKALLDKA